VGPFLCGVRVLGLRKRLSDYGPKIAVVVKNTLREMVKSGQTAIGTTITIGHPDVAEALAYLGYDWIMIDTEHAPLDVAMVQVLLQAMSYSKTIPLVRVPWNDLVLVKRTLDIGAHGVVVPWVNSKEEAMRAVQSVRYPPEGLRGFGPRRAAMRDSEYVQTANDAVFLGVQIETKKGVDNIDEILSVKGVDAALVGPADLSLSLGKIGKYDDPVFVDAMDRIATSAKRHEVIAGMLAVDDVAKRVAQGFRLLNKSGDLGILMEAAGRSLKEAREAARSVAG
jgi:2-keto-3-deoxy-L-rhamnonate aldolase RhmA